MAEKNGFPLFWLAPIVFIAVLVVGGFLVYQTTQNVSTEQVACTMDAMQCPDGSYIGRTGPNCEFACPTTQTAGETYKNAQYGFELQLPETWTGYSVLAQSWEGRRIDTGIVVFGGPQFVVRNQKWTIEKPWQDITVMVFTKEEWQLVLSENLSLGAAPIPPGKLGENQKYIFALPARWVGFTDALGQDEAQKIVLTFKAY